ncbi:hypothetical protein V2J09_002791 [Rumex salicifolius]
MQEAIPHRGWAGAAMRPMGRTLVLAGQGNDDNTPGDGEEIRKIVEENGVVVFGRRGCCMSHVVKTLFLRLGANPPLFEVDDTDHLLVELSKIDGGDQGGLQFPVVFIGGKIFGGLEKVMGAHISGELVPILRQAGALWL